MQRYKSIKKNSGVTAYEIKPESIIVEFTYGPTYVYDYHLPGKEHVEEMKRLAEAGEGLSTYISKYVRDMYASKIK